MVREPGYCLHKPTGQAYVNLGGKVFYLGTYGTPESRQRYATLKGEWLVNRNAVKFAANESGPTMAQIALSFLDHAEAYYGQGTELENIKLALRPISELYAKLPAARFGPLEYRAIRQWWLDRDGRKRKGEDEAKKLTRQYVNAQMKRLTRMVKWAVGQGSIPPSVHQAIKCVDPLKRGRSTAPEAEPIMPVDQAVVDATCRHLPPVVADMVKLQLLLGCRPGEVCALKPKDVDRTKEIWEIRLADHKTAWRGKERLIFCGPKAQRILAKYLLRGADEFCFSPAEATEQRLRVKNESRKTPPSCGNVRGSNVKVRPRKSPGTSYTSGTYARAIRYGCIAAKVIPWAPNRLRHSRATEVRARFGLEAASAVLGHSEITVTQVYAERDREQAVRVAKEIG
jgi:integrase